MKRSAACPSDFARRWCCVTWRVIRTRYAAEQFDCPVGTIKSRLATAREKLRRRLTRRGVAPARSRRITQLRRRSRHRVCFRSRLRKPHCAVPFRLGSRTKALAGIASAEAIALMQGAVKTMAIVRVTVLTTVVMFSGLAATGAVLAYHGLGRQDGHAAEAGAVELAGQPKAPQIAAPKSDQPSVQQGAVRESAVREAQDRVKALIREFEADQLEFRKIAQKTKNVDEAKKLMRSHRGATPAFYAGALLQLAEAMPGTPAAEEGLIWIATHLVYGTITERAKEMLARDHAHSDKLEPVFNDIQVRMAGSKPTERLFRAVLDRNANRKIKGLACFYLAKYLDYQASFVRLEQLLKPEQLKDMPPMNNGWGDDYQDRLRKMDAEVLEREAAPLYARVTKEFADLPLANPGEDRALPGRPTNLGGAAGLYLHELEHVTVSRPAPEIEGIDLDGKAMKLSDCRGKVVALIFSVVDQTKGFQLQPPMRAVAKRLAGESFVLLGVTASPFPGTPAPSASREALKKAMDSSDLPIRFWYDLDREGKPGPIQTAWNARFVTNLIDHRGVIRYKHLTRPEFFENGAAILMRELAEEKARSTKRE